MSKKLATTGVPTKADIKNAKDQARRFGNSTGDAAAYAKHLAAARAAARGKK